MAVHRERRFSQALRDAPGGSSRAGIRIACLRARTALQQVHYETGIECPFPTQMLDLQVRSESEENIWEAAQGQNRKLTGSQLRQGRLGSPRPMGIGGRWLTVCYCTLLTIQDDLFVTPCCLLALTMEYRRAELLQDSLGAAEVGFSCGCIGRGLTPQQTMQSMV